MVATNKNRMLSCNGDIVSYEDLASVAIPAQTKSYTPVPHQELVLNVLKVAKDFLGNEFDLQDQTFALTREGQRFFGLINFVQKEGDDVLSLAMRNSYDKSIALALGIGRQVMICTNLQVSGDVVTMHKHTTNILETLHNTIIRSLYQAKERFLSLLADSKKLEQVSLNDDDAHSFFGRLIGNNVLSPRQSTVCFADWAKPRHEEFVPRTAWSAYNCVNEALKTSPPNTILENHYSLHRQAMSDFGAIEAEYEVA